MTASNKHDTNQGLELKVLKKHLTYSSLESPSLHMHFSYNCFSI